MPHYDFFFDTQDSNPNSNLVRKMEDVLCIFSHCGVFILDMAAIMSDEDYKEETSPKRPPLKRILNFVQSGLPFGMGLVKFENFLYMFGGEYPSEDPNLSQFRCGPLVYGFGIPREDPPCPVFRLDLTNDLSEPVLLRPMLGPKLYAIVEEIGGKIYVLSQKHLSSSLPMFEVLNPMTEEWRTLPSPFEPSDSSQIAYHCVSGSEIICRMQSSYIYWRFSIVTETWEYTKDISSSEEMAMSGRFDVQHEDVYLPSWGKDGELWAILDGPERRDGYSTGINSINIQPHVLDFEMYSDANLVDTSEQGEYMCGLVQYISNEDDGEGFALYVFVFQVEKHEPEKVPLSQGALSVRYLRRQVYDFTYIKSQSKQSPIFSIGEAVIGRLSYNTSIGSGEAKRNRNDDDDDDEEDEGQVNSIHGLF